MAELNRNTQRVDVRGRIIELGKLRVAAVTVYDHSYPVVEVSTAINRLAVISAVPPVATLAGQEDGLAPAIDYAELSRDLVAYRYHPEDIIPPIVIRHPAAPGRKTLVWAVPIPISEHCRSKPEVIIGATCKIITYVPRADRYAELPFGTTVGQGYFARVPPLVITSATPLITADQTGFNGAFGNVVMGTNSISRQFLVSTAAATGFAATATLSPVSGTVAATPIYARYAPAAATGASGTFGNVVTGTNSATQQYTVTGANLTADIVLTAPAGFSISTTAASGFASTLTLTQTSGVVAATTIYVRYSPTAASGATGNLTISHTSTGAVTQQVTVSGNALSVEPSAAGTISFGTTTLNSIVLNLPTVGNGSSRIIVARAGSAVTFIPADGLAVTGVNANFTTATDQGTGNRIVYEGTGSGNGVVTVSGLTPATTYYFTVYEYNRGTGNSYNYLATPVATGNTATQTPPAVIVADATGLNGNFGNVVMGTNVAGRQYSVSTSAAAGFGTSLTLSPSAGAIPVTSIYVRYAPTAATGATGNVNITHTSTGAPSQDVAVSGNALATQPTSIGTIGFGTLTSNSIVINLPTVGNGNKRIIVAKQGAAPAFVPTDGIAVTGVNANFTTASDQGAGERVVYDGAASGSSVVLAGSGKIIYDGTGSGANVVKLIGLTPGMLYYFTVYEYNMGTGTSHNYLVNRAANSNMTTSVYVPNSVGNNPIAKQIKIFPNPVKNIIYAEAPIAVHITITDAMGRMMVRLMNAKQADMSAFPAGYYQVLITDTTGKLLKTEKVLKAD
ncbi:Tat pathway signal sequence domain protein [Ostertagia ostertagi]